MGLERRDAGRWMSKDEQRRTFLPPNAFGLFRWGTRFGTMESRGLIWPRAYGDDLNLKTVWPPVSCRSLSCDGTIVHYSSSR